jgi:multiple sugar transport system ATP-binding protein
MAEVVLERVSKRYPGGVLALDNLDLTAADGELLVLVGPSGCGKSTTLRLIAGLETPTEGTLRIDGRVVNALPPRQRRVALVFQRPALYPHLNVRQNLAFGLRLASSDGGLLRGMLAAVGLRSAESPADAKEIGEVAHSLGLEPLLDRLPAQLSGGEQQRVALGRALVRRPAVFLLDEPLSNLDVPLRAEMRRELHLLHRRIRATMIYVTHDQIEAMTLGDRVVVLNRGVVQQVARPQVLYENPANRFVAGFIGWPPMNFLEGQFTEAGGQCRFASEGSWLAIPEEARQRWAAHRGRPVTLGIRPEDVELTAPVAETFSPQPETTLLECLGASTLVTLQQGGWQFTAQVRGRDAPAPGKKVGVVFNLEKAHIFERATGLALSHAASG